MEDKVNPLSGLSSFIGEYLNARRDDFRKSVITGLSAGFSRVLAILIISLLMVIVLAVFAFAFIILLGEALGSLSGAALIIGGIYLAGAAVLFFLRKRLFVNMFTNLFTGIMQTSAPDDGWKSLLLLLVQNLRKNLEG
ncbi:MAG: hypothetical protein IKU36_12070 [Bacteroidales bacterium]|nr:hypothetical protein [Bacteroidales bacterium]